MRPSLAAAVTSLALAGCGDDSDTHTAPRPADAGLPSAPCVPGELALDDGTCLPAGMQRNGCPAGDAIDADGACIAAGVPPAACARGFTPDADRGCTAVLPTNPCPLGKMAVPGEATCRDVAPCAAGTWGDIPTEADTVFVDGSYAGAMEDGSQAAPFKTIQIAIDAAAPNAIVAVAAGSYSEDVGISDKPVRLWGRCPSMVEIVGTPDAFGTITFFPGASGSEVRDLAVTGGFLGVAASGVTGVVLDRLWIHDVPERGVNIQAQLGPTEITLRRSLVERAGDGEVAVFSAGSDTTIEDSVVRGRGSVSSSTLGVFSQPDPDATGPTKIVVRRSLVEDVWDSGIWFRGSDGLVEATVVRDVRPISARFLGSAIVGSTMAPSGPVAIEIRQSVLERTVGAGIDLNGADLLVEHTTVRDVMWSAEVGFGNGIRSVAETDRPVIDVRASVVARTQGSGVLALASEVTVQDCWIGALDASGGESRPVGVYTQLSPETLVPSTLTVARSSIEGAAGGGIEIHGGDLVIDGVAVRDTAPGGLAHGRGIGAQVDLGVPATARVTSSIVERAHDIGIFGSGADLTLEATLVRDTRSTVTGTSGAGVHAQSDGAAMPTVSVRGCVVEGSREFGMVLGESNITIDATLVRATTPSDEGLFGDGLAVVTQDHLAVAAITDSRIDASARAGIVSFGATVSLATTTLECAGFSLDGEPNYGNDFSFSDLGGNVCGCLGETSTCQVVTSNLTPPSAF